MTARAACHRPAARAPPRFCGAWYHPCDTTFAGRGGGGITRMIPPCPRRDSNRNPQRVEKLDMLQRGQQPRTVTPNAAISPFGIPFDKILRQIAHLSLCSSHTICRKISLSVSPSSAHLRPKSRALRPGWPPKRACGRSVRQWRRILTFSTI